MEFVRSRQLGGHLGGADKFASKMASTANPGASRDAVNVNALIAQHAELQRKLKLKHCETNALKEHLKSLMEEKTTLEREGQAKLDRLNTLKRLHQAKKDELARNLKMKAMFESCIYRDSDVSSDEESVEIPDLNQLKLAKKAYEEELKDRKWLEQLHQAKFRAENAEHEKIKIKERYDEELKLFHEAYDKLDRYRRLNYRDFILESVLTAKKIHEQRKKLAVFLVRNAKFNSTTDDSLEEDCKSPEIINHSHVDTPRPPTARPLHSKENVVKPQEVHVRPKVDVEKIASQQKGYSSDAESVISTKMNSQPIPFVSDYSSQDPRSNELEEEDIMEEDQQDLEENDSQVEEEMPQVNESQEDSVVIADDDDEQNRSDSVLLHDDKSFEEQNEKENREGEIGGGEGFGFHVDDDENNSIIIDDNEEKDDSFKLGDSLSLTSQNKDVNRISPKSPVFAVPKVPDKKLGKKKASEPVFNIEDTSFSFSNFDPTKNGSQNVDGDILGQIIDTSMNSADPASDFLNLAGNSAGNDTHDGGFNFNLFNSDEAEEIGDDNQFNFNLSNSGDKNENNFFGF
ncbi:unnamed protein product [Bursaphelenchus xylophilus]|uniref:(pine wood nematode) hypothetical protein n=1 Tax=Bursaphelenchus xylophilus TaxID=6326 RepID=A0A1I7RZH4_BURXY|nr:unnamed protein product [Bursaphelenchus xylophilus]CAG9106380.1 unnamed protein product [Bursaphelenchus xylophilus]